jgi:hypothetical protein
MNGDIEELLRDGLDRLTAQVRLPAGLAARARARQRRRRIAVRSALACGTAAVMVAAVIAATDPARGVPAATPIQAQTAAYVIQRVAQALTEKNVVIQAESTFSPVWPAIETWNYRQDFRSVQSGFIPPAEVPGMPWAQGQHDWGIGTTTIHGQRAYVQIDYRTHEWFPTAQFLVVPNGCSAGLDQAEYNPANWATYVPQTLACGEFKIAGHARVDGRSTIKITASAPGPNWWAQGPHAVTRGQSQIDATLYVDPVTYLPVKLIWSNQTRAANGKPLSGTVTVEFQLLPPTLRNMAKARASVPAGFRRVPDATFGGPIFQFFGQ